MAADYRIDYKISIAAKIALICLWVIFLTGFIIKAVSMWVQPSFFSFVFFVLFGILLSFCCAAVWAFVFKKRSVISISSQHISIAIPYFFEIRDVELSNVKEIKTSMLLRSEVIWLDQGDYVSYAFMWPFLSAEDRESFLSNIFDLLPNTSVR